MSVAAAAGIGVPAQLVLHFRFVQRIVQLAHRGRRVAERRVGGDILDAFAVDVDLTAILQAFQVLFTG